MKKKMKILLAYDGMHPIQYFTEDLRKAGLPAKVDVLVITVVDALSFQDSSARVIPESLMVDIQAMQDKAEIDTKSAKKRAEKAAKDLRKNFRGWSVKSEVCVGSPASSIVKRADEWKPDLMVIGSHGAPVVARFFLGSVARNVLLHSKCSVRIVREHSQVEDHVRLLIGIDMSLNSQAAVQKVSERAWPKGTSVRLVTGFDQNMIYSMVFHPLPAAKRIGSKPQGEETWVRQMTAPWVERLEKAGLKVSVILKAGKPWKVLTAEAQKWKADCVFMGARGLGRWDRFLLGSVSNAVASRAHCSVEIVRPSK